MQARARKGEQATLSLVHSYFRFRALFRSAIVDQLLKMLLDSTIIVGFMVS